MARECPGTGRGVQRRDDEKSLQILRNVRTAMNSDARRLLIVGSVVPDDDREHLSKLLDPGMLVGANGGERTESEYAELLRQAGFRFMRTVATVGPASIVEAVPA
ncbi:MAG: methyltransferase [Mycobacterium sp.]